MRRLRQPAGPPGSQAHAPTALHTRSRPTRNDEAGRSRPARSARPSGRRSCDRPARSAPPHKAGKSAAAPCGRARPETAPGNAKAPPANPPCSAPHAFGARNLTPTWLTNSQSAKAGLIFNQVQTALLEYLIARGNKADIDKCG